MLEAVEFQAEQYGREIADILERAGSGVHPLPLVRTGPALPELRTAISELRTTESVRSGLYLYCGCWDEAHSAADSVDRPDGYFWHGVVHRQEPDPGNAAYWFRKTAVHPVFARLGEEAGQCGYRIEPTAFNEHAQVMAAESRLDGRVPPLFGAASGGPCAFNEHAQVMAAESRLDGRVPPLFGAASGGPCAFEEHAQVLAAESRLDGRVPPLFGAASGGPCALGRAWDPFAFIEYCESARRRPGSKEEQVAMKVQLIEWQLLFDYCARGSRG
jgi:hypothetical protein